MSDINHVNVVLGVIGIYYQFVYQVVLWSGQMCIKNNDKI